MVKDWGFRMATGRWGYHLVWPTDPTSEPTSLIAAWVAADQPLRAVLWSPPRNRWVSAPAIAARTLYDDLNPATTKPVDRQTAERIALEHLGAELPTEEELHRIAEEGERLNQPWGPMTPPR
jgi:hypothetical protein